MLLYMPSWGLTSSIAMSHLKSEEFSKIRLFGSVGWVVSGIFSLISVKLFNSPFDGTNLPFFIAAAIGFLAGILNLFLPATPPAGKGKRFSVSDAFGLRTVTLMRERNFAMFIILSFLFMIPFSIYFSYCSEFLLNRNFKYISITMNMGQLLEMLFLLTIPLSIKKAGLRNTMIFGIIAMVIRYIVFYAGTVTDLTGFFMTGIMLQGIIFGYFLVGGQIYIDRKAPAELKAQAQGFIFFVTIGLGLLAGNFISGQLIEHFSSSTNGVRAYDWNSIWAVTSVSTLVLLLAFIVLFKKKPLDEVAREAVSDLK
jgi:MFS family permease